MNMRSPTIVAALVLGLSLSACASGGTSTAREDWNVITAEEVAESNQSTAYDLVRSKRPRWLQTRGVQSINMSGDIVVYLDGTRLGGPESLRSIHVSSVSSMRYYDASSATQRWGTGHTFGAIQVITP